MSFHFVRLCKTDVVESDKGFVMEKGALVVMFGNFTKTDTVMLKAFNDGNYGKGLLMLDAIYPDVMLTYYNKFAFCRRQDPDFRRLQEPSQICEPQYR